ncbi:hypothetical protein EIP91_007247 [Steccherinum ochraceum]|uniref:WSC domain-containing protein n=1 Tax=Steccherinum ochraceum TaxID=92696 RepID=A0A4R0RCQ8_9APHY|nr:hypothetical protein EIP91_007247 [Steccherinum ochraceum]
MHFFVITILSAFSVRASTEICRFVCPSSAAGEELLDESLSDSGAATGCFWFGGPTGGGLAPRSASYDSNGDLIPFSESSNNEGLVRADTFCAGVTDGWDFAQHQVCIKDSVSARILEQDTVMPLPSNSPETCTAACDSQGFTFAGVEFGAECHCGTGFTATIQPVPHVQCNMRCTGNSSEVCGAGDLIQVFQGPNPPRAAQLPTGWSTFSDAPCAQDSAARMFTDTLIAGPLLAGTDTPAACVQFCEGKGFTKAGVEGGDECYCGTEIRAAPQALDPSQCNLPCQGAIGVKCGGDFAIQLYELS